MIIDLSGKSAVVTGSTGGIGLSIATGLANAGARVTIVGRTQERVDAALAHVREASGTRRSLRPAPRPRRSRMCARPAAEAMPSVSPLTLELRKAVGH